MKRTAVAELPVDRLVEEFAALRVEQDKAGRADDIAKVNRLFRANMCLWAVDNGTFVPE